MSKNLFNLALLTGTIRFMIAAFLLATTAAGAQTDTTFTYQGSLTDDGSPANGAYDIEAKLFNALTGGSQIGSPQTVLGVPVCDGVFTIRVDFGAEAFQSSRWLEIVINGTTTEPRHPITRVPYAVQTRGIFVDQAGDIGMGTSLPEGKLHVRDGSAGAVTAQANSSAVLERSGTNFLSILSPNTTERGILFGDPESFVNGGIVYNNPSTPDGFEFRTGGNLKRMVIDAEGRLGIGTPSPVGFAKMTAVGTAANESAMYVLNGSPSAATVRIDNVAQGYALQAESAADVSASGGGIVIVGDESTSNIAIDQNEIMARNNGQSSTLFLNADGGDISFGPQRTGPALAFGAISSNGTIRSVSANITSVQRTGEGRYAIDISGGFRLSDVMIATPEGGATAGANLGIAGSTTMFITTKRDGDDKDWPFSFVVYRP